MTAYIGLCRILPLPMRAYMRGVLAQFTRPVRRLTIYDQLNPAYAKYYTRAEAETLLAQGGFVDIQLYHRRAKAWPLLLGDPRRGALQLADALFGPVEGR